MQEKSVYLQEIQNCKRNLTYINLSRTSVRETNTRLEVQELMSRGGSRLTQLQREFPNWMVDEETFPERTPQG